MIVDKAFAKLLPKVKSHPKVPTRQMITEWLKETNCPALRAKTIIKRSMEKKVQKVKKEVQKKPASPETFDDLEYIPDIHMMRKGSSFTTKLLLAKAGC